LGQGIFLENLMGRKEKGRDFSGPVVLEVERIERWLLVFHFP